MFGTSSEDVGITQHVFYSLDDCVKLGARLEGWKDGGIDHYELTGGMNIMPHANGFLLPKFATTGQVEPTLTRRHLEWTP